MKFLENGDQFVLKIETKILSQDTSYGNQACGIVEGTACIFIPRVTHLKSLAVFLPVFETSIAVK